MAMADIPFVNLNYWVLQTIAMLLTALLVPKLKVSGPLGALGAVVALAFVNAHLWDAALFFSLPDSLGYRALLLFVSNGVLFWILVKILPGIEVEGVVAAFVAPLVFTIASILVAEYGQDIDWAKVWDAIVEFVKSVKKEVQ